MKMFQYFERVASVSIDAGKAHCLSFMLVKKKKKMEKRNSISQNQSLESTFDTKNTEEAQSHEQANANSGSIKGFFA